LVIVYELAICHCDEQSKYLQRRFEMLIRCQRHCAERKNEVLAIVVAW
jgi:hypothetical protein